MTGTPELSRGDEYIVFYTGGPYDGQTDRRISTDGTWESEITVLATVGGQEQVTYSWDQPDSEPLEALDERNDD